MITMRNALAFAVLAAQTGFGQGRAGAPPVPPVPPAFEFQTKQFEEQAQRFAEQAQHIQDQWQQDFQFSFDGSNDSYRQGQQALDRRNYEQAVTRFDRAIASKSPRSDGALYWKAYALHKLGRRDPALAALAELEKQFPKSRWLNDARALAMEVRASTGQFEELRHDIEDRGILSKVKGFESFMREGDLL